MRRAMADLKWLFPVILFYVLTGCGGGGGGGGGGGSAPATYTVTYDGNGSTGGSAPTDPTSYQQGQIVTVLGNSGYLTRTGYTFSGWNTRADGNGTTYSQNQTFAIGSANVILYARWTTNPTYTVTYNGNNNTGGDVPVDTTNYEQGQIVTVLGNTGTLVKTGYYFAGWNTRADGNGTTYAEEHTFAMGSANVILYAIWTVNPTYTVTYNGNTNDSGSVPIDSTNYQQGEAVTVPGNPGTLVKSGSTFAGWNTQAAGNGTTYTQGQTFNIGSSDVTLYAKWTINPTYTLTYNGNGSTGGSVPVDTTNYEDGQTVTVLGNLWSLVRSGYTFAGWNTQADGNGTSYTQGQTFTMSTSNVTLYAKWTANPTYTVSYDGNGKDGGSVPTDSTNYQQGQTVTVLANTGNLTRTGYTFAGWNTQADGNGTTFTQDQTFIMGSANVTLYAKWTANPTYTVTYNGNTNTGGNVPTDSTNYENLQTVAVLGNTGNLVKTGSTFAGWNTQAAGNGTSYTQGQTFTMGTSNVTLYAKWTANPTYNVTYNGNGNTSGSVPTDSTNYEDGQTVTVAGNPGSLVKTGYFPFVGWNTQADGNGTTYTQSQTFTMGAANVTLYAKWGELPDTGQTTSYTTTSGEDNDYTIHAPLYTDNGDGTIYDGVTGLTWQKCTYGTASDCSGTAVTSNWYQASGTYDATYNNTTINRCGSLSLAGGGWRLPTRIELLTIMDYDKSSPAVNATYFPETRSAYYWSSTPNAGSSTGTSAWAPDFSIGAAANGWTKGGSSLYIRCVRGSGRTGSYAAGTDTVTDNTTGLVWQKQDDGTPRTWEDAVSYCETLSLDSNTDWRLPNIKELSSVVDDTRYNAAIDPAFASPKSSAYWSSSTYKVTTTNAWAVDFYYGMTGYGGKTSTFYVRCVLGK